MDKMNKVVKTSTAFKIFVVVLAIILLFLSHRAFAI